MRATIMKPGDDDSSTKGAAASANDESAGAAKTPTKDEFEAEFDPNDKGELHVTFPTTTKTAACKHEYCRIAIRYPHQQSARQLRSNR